MYNYYYPHYLTDGFSNNLPLLYPTSNNSENDDSKLTSDKPMADHWVQPVLLFMFPSFKQIIRHTVPLTSLMKL